MIIIIIIIIPRVIFLPFEQIFIMPVGIVIYKCTELSRVIAPYTSLRIEQLIWNVD